MGTARDEDEVVAAEAVMERTMRALQWLAAVALVVAGIMLLVKPVSAHSEVRVVVRAVAR